MLENGRRQPNLAHIGQLADALGIDTGALTDPEPPTRRAEMEIDLERMQADPRFSHLGLPYVRPSPTLSDQILGHMLGLYRALESGPTGPGDLRRANAATGAWIRRHDGYLSDVEAVAQGVLALVGHQGDRPLSSRNLLDLAAHLGFTIEAVDDMVPDVRSVTDTVNGRIYIAQRNELRTRQARKAILQTLAGRLLGHGRPSGLDEYLRQRVETAYLAGAVLVPESAVVDRLRHDRRRRDIAIEDLKEAFYVSYEMAAWRFVNLATERFDIRTHLLVSNEEGVVVKGYANDGLPFTTDDAGGMEAQPICRRWGAVAVYDSTDKFDVHAQHTDTPAGTYFCVTHTEPDRPYAITVGVPAETAQWFRHRDTTRSTVSSCPDPACCRRPTPDQERRWNGHIEVSLRTQHRLLERLAADLYPPVHDRPVYDLVERHS